MDRDQTEAPAKWQEELARSDEDIARGDVVSASAVHERLRAAIEALETEIAAETNTQSTGQHRP
jgi:hypothetical protein